MNELKQAGNSIHVFYNDEGVWEDAPDFIKDPERAFEEGRTHWWIVDENNLRLCDDIYVHRPGKIVFKARIDHARSSRREIDNRTEIAFSDPERVDEPFDWSNQNPVRYNALTRAPLTSGGRLKPRANPRAFRLTDDVIREAIKKTGISKLRKPADMAKLVKEVAQKKPVNQQELTVAAIEVCSHYNAGTS